MSQSQKVIELELGAPIVVGHKAIFFKRSFFYANRTSWVVLCQADPDEVHGFVVWRVERGIDGALFAESGDYYAETDLVEAVQAYDARD